MRFQVNGYSLFGGLVRNINSSLGINQNPSVITVSVVEDGGNVVVANRDVVDISIGKFQFRGVVQSWSHVKVDVSGKNIYKIRLTDTKPVLNAAQIIIGSSFNDIHTQAFDYGDNVIPVIFATVSEIADGVRFGSLKTAVESSTIKYGNQSYTVKFNFTLPPRGSVIEYSLKGRALSLLEFISQVANDHGLDWYVTTSSDNVISINMFGRSNITDITVDQLAALHSGSVIRRQEGQENRDAIQKVVLLGGYKTYLKYADGIFWQQFWGFDEQSRKRTLPLYPESVMESIINNDFTSADYTEQEVQKILSYANEFWGRKFIGLVEPKQAVGADGRSWIIPTSAAWDANNLIVGNEGGFFNSFTQFNQVKFDRDGQTKFQTNDGRWVTFVTLPLPGTRTTSAITKLTYQWDDTLFSNTNSHINNDNDIFIKTSLEIADDFGELAFVLEEFIVFILNLSNFVSVGASLSIFFTLNPDISLIVRNDLSRFVVTHHVIITDIAQGKVLYTDTIKNDITKLFKDEYFILTLATPLRIKAVQKTEGKPDVIFKTRLQNLDRVYLSLLDQRETYGPWANIDNAIGRAEVIVDNSLTPWSFGYRGINNDIGINLMNRVARAKIKTVADTVLDAKTVELEVAGLPAMNIGDQLQTTGIITAINIVFGINGLRTTYQSLRHTNELSKNLRLQQDLLDTLRRQAAEFNNTTQPPKDEIRALKKELPEPSVSVPNEGNRRQLKVLSGRINSRSSDISPQYNITPMAWVSDVLGQLILIRDPEIFGDFLGVVNMGERPDAPGRLAIGTDVRVHEFSVTDGGIVSYFIDTAAPKPPSFTATITSKVSATQPIYRVSPVVDAIQQINLLPTELLSLNNVINLGETVNFPGSMPNGTQVTISWNENINGSFIPTMEQQLNLFKPI